MRLFGVKKKQLGNLWFIEIETLRIRRLQKMVSENGDNPETRTGRIFSGCVVKVRRTNRRNRNHFLQESDSTDLSGHLPLLSQLSRFITRAVR